MSSSKDNSNRQSRIAQGKVFERLAGHFYEDRGFNILERNWRAGHKEIDLIVAKDRTVVFVEVKSSFSKKFGHPVERVDKRKVHNLSECARQYIITKDLHDCDLRFDVVTFKDGQMEHYPDAFEAD